METVTGTAQIGELLVLDALELRRRCFVLQAKFVERQGFFIAITFNSRDFLATFLTVFFLQIFV